MKFRVEKLDVSVALLAGASCLFMYLDVPVWAICIGWAWYFTLGAVPVQIVKCIPPAICGGALAVVAYLLIDLFNHFITNNHPGFWIVAVIIPVTITVFLLMLSLKIPRLNVSLASFNAYSCFFVGFAAETFRPVSGFEVHLNALIWIVGANIIGLLFGWASVRLARAAARRRWLIANVSATLPNEVQDDKESAMIQCVKKRVRLSD
jgi:hypothetical protein